MLILEGEKKPEKKLDENYCQINEKKVVMLLLIK